ncbi:thiamine phosphate synthase [Nevskia sp.]|uniref:thiamine phosphate synthase n=1 Tax=Nevskia sp. TaxID=1929292 RepID=UPI0025D0AF89|nr:thiamine phosphate synthase [Nevskia sp.]
MSARLLYAVTPDSLAADPARLLDACAAALAGGARLLQYRDKRSAPDAKQRNAEALAALCRARGARFIVNDDALLAKAVAADGVHLGKSDGALEAARALLGPDALIGASCGSDLLRAEAALASGASYLAFGRFFASNTKPDAPPANPSALTEARKRFTAPICAIGGVTPDNGALLLSAGADWLAAVDGLFGAGDAADIERRARAYCALFEQPR